MTADAFAADALVAATFATGAFTADAFAADALVAATFATDSIAADAFAADAIAEIVDAVWNETSTGHVDAGKAGQQLWTDVDAILVDTGTTLQAELDAIQAAVITNAAGTDIAADIIAVKAETASILADTDDIGVAGAGLTDLGGMSSGMKDQVNVEAKDVLNTDTYAEPGQGDPLATTTLAQKIGYLFKFLRNRMRQTNDTFEVYADDATTVDQKAAVSNTGGVTNRSEIEGGP